MLLRVNQNFTIKVLNTDEMSEREKFVLNERLSSYAAAGIFTLNNIDEIQYRHKKGWFFSRWYTISAGIIIAFIFFIIIYVILSSKTNTTIIPKSLDANSTGNVIKAKQELPHIKIPTLIIDKNPHGISSKELRDNLDFKYLIQPISYNIYIKPNLKDHLDMSFEEFSFTAEASIIFRTREQLTYIILAAGELTIKKISLRELKNFDGDMNTTEIEQIVDDSIHSYEIKEGGTLLIDFANVVIPFSMYELKIKYVGFIHRLMYGLFYYMHLSKTNQFRWLLGSNTNTPFARTIFPCFDSIDQTASFQLNFQREKLFTIEFGSNFALTKTEKDGTTWYRYRSIEKISTNMLNFVITNFANTELKTQQLEHFSVSTIMENNDDITYFIHIGPKIIKILHIYFSYPVPVKKINVLVLPTDIPYHKSKMGPIYVSEQNIMVKPNMTSEKLKQTVALTMTAHLIDQWVNNLIHMKWDNDEWIKESLVFYLKYVAVSFIQPTWNMLDQFYVNIQQVEMELQAERSSEYIRWIPKINLEQKDYNYKYPVNETSLFDASEILFTPNVSYEMNANIYNYLFQQKFLRKGACIFRMIQHMITEPVFKNSITKFLQKSKTKQMERNDLWDTMTEEVKNKSDVDYQLLPENVSLETVLENWIYADGYPILEVHRDYKQKKITFSQNVITMHTYKFLTSQSEFWYIPISFTTENEKYFEATAPRLWLTKEKQLEIEASDLEEYMWILVNPHQTAFYRIQYDDHNWKLLREVLLSGQFPPSIRSQLIDDALYFARKELMDYSFALSLTLLFNGFEETNYVVWKTYLRHLHYFKYLLYSVVIAEPNPNDVQNLNKTISLNNWTMFKSYVEIQIKPAFFELNTKYEINHYLNHNDKLLRSKIFYWSCMMGLTDCQQKADELFAQWTNLPISNENNPIEPDLQYPILCYVMDKGHESDLTFLYERYIKTLDNDYNKHIYLKSLFCYKDDKILYKLLSETLHHEYNLKQLHNVLKIWNALKDTYYFSESPFKYLIDNWAIIKTRYLQYKPIMSAIVEGATANIVNEQTLAQLKKFQQQNINDLPYLAKIIQNSIRNAEERILWMKTRMESFINWIKNSRESFITYKN